MPVVKRRKHAEEEEEDDEIYTQHEISGSEEGSDQEEILEEEEEEEIQYETDSPSNDEEELPTTSKSLRDVADDSKRRQIKRKTLDSKTTPTKKPKTTPAKSLPAKKQPTKLVKKVSSKGKSIAEKKPVNDEGKKNVSIVEYNDKNVDYNLYNEAPEHIKNLKIKISSNVVMLSRMIEATGNTSQGLTYDYAALSFVRQSKNGKAYEFNLPLNLAPCIVKGINLMIKNNPKFFEKQIKTQLPSADESISEME